MNTAVRILHAHQPQSLQSLWEGADRNFGWRNSTRNPTSSRRLHVPPVDVLAEFLDDHPDFSVGATGMVTTEVALDQADFGREKTVLLQALRALPHPLTTRNALIETCAAAGTPRATAGVLITYVEFVERVETNVWGIRGACNDVPRAHIDDLKRQAAEEAAAFDTARTHGESTGKRRLWFAQRITPTFLNSGVLSNDWHRNLLDGSRYAVTDGIDGEQEGSLRFAGSFCHGYMKILIKHRPSAGDAVRVTVDRDTGAAVVEIGGEELLTTPPYLEDPGD